MPPTPDKNFIRRNSAMPAPVRVMNKPTGRTATYDPVERSKRAEKNRQRAEKSINDDNSLNDPWSQPTAIGMTPSEVIAAGEIAGAAYGAGKAVLRAGGEVVAEQAAKRKAKQEASKRMFNAPKPTGSAQTAASRLRPRTKPAMPAKPKPSAPSTTPGTRIVKPKPLTSRLKQRSLYDELRGGG